VPRTLSEAFDHDMDNPDVTKAIRRYSKGSRSADWRADDLRILKAVGIILASAIGLFIWFY
jgi:hypothetical protein